MLLIKCQDKLLLDDSAKDFSELFPWAQFLVLNPSPYSVALIRSALVTAGCSVR